MKKPMAIFGASVISVMAVVVVAMNTGEIEPVSVDETVSLPERTLRKVVKDFLQIEDETSEDPVSELAVGELRKERDRLVVNDALPPAAETLRTSVEEMRLEVERINQEAEEAEGRAGGKDVYSKETDQLLLEADLLIAEVSQKYGITQDEISALTNMQPETADPELIELNSKLEQLDDEMIELERRAGSF
ncbi:MAG: hypothetical protein M3H12_07725 [Chromatiales bacterium]|nr:hypothetical protein [Gammaproteobacteria bacterium]